MFNNYSDNYWLFEKSPGQDIPPLPSPAILTTRRRNGYVNNDPSKTSSLEISYVRCGLSIPDVTKQLATHAQCVKYICV